MLKFIVDTLEGLDEATAKLYTKTEGGKFQLAIEGLPKAEDVAGLKAKIDELLGEKKAAAKAAREAEESARLAAEEAARKSGDVKALEESWKAKLDKAVADAQKRTESLLQAINSLTVDAAAMRIASEIAVPGSADVLLPHIRGRLSVEDREGKFVTVVRDAQGKPSAASLDDLKSEISANTAFAPLIVGSRANGGGANGGGKGGGAATVKRAAFDGMTPVQQQAHIRDGGTVVD